MANDQGNETSRTRRSVKVLLFVSLAINLMVFGVVGGAYFHNAGHSHEGRPPVAQVDLGLGPYGKALSPGQRREIRREFTDHSAWRSRDRSDVRAEMIAVLKVLRDATFDPEVLSRTMEKQQNRLIRGQNLGKQVLVDFLSEMDVQQRRDYADRLEKALGRLVR